MHFDLSFWLPDESNFTATDFYDLVHTSGESLIENVSIFILTYITNIF